MLTCQAIACFIANHGSRREVKLEAGNVRRRTDGCLGRRAESGGHAGEKSIAEVADPSASASSQSQKEVTVRILQP